MTSEREERTTCVNCKAALDSPESLYCTSCGARQSEVPERTSAAETTAHSAPASGSRAESEQYGRYSPLEEESSRSAAGGMLPNSCRRCNSELAPNENYCTTCGLPVRVAGSGTTNVAAKPCTRVFAFALDFILVNIVSFIITIVVLLIVSINELMRSFRENTDFVNSSGLPVIFWVTVAITMLLQIAYFGILNAKNRQTLFKKLLGIRAVGMQGEGLEYGKSFTRAFLTYIGILLSSLGFYLANFAEVQVGIFFGVGFLILLADALTSVFREDRFTLHDLAASTRVINTRA